MDEVLEIAKSAKENRKFISGAGTAVKNKIKGREHKQGY
jgi:hypothetical protein